MLADELGLDPSPPVVEIEQRVLLQDPTLLIAQAPAVWPSEELPTPAAPVSAPAGGAAQHVVGRHDAVSALEVAVQNAAGGRGCVLVFQAPAGFGKSTMMQVLA